jgi:hypothetical protein
VAHLSGAYGETVAAAIHTPPPLVASIAADALDSDSSGFLGMPWLHCPPEDLACALCGLSWTDISACIRQQADNIHSSIDT